MKPFTYAPDEVSLIFGGEIITGFADGESIKIEPVADRFTSQVGSQGDLTRTKSSNKLCKLTVVLQHNSPSNAVFQGAIINDENTNNGYEPVLLRDGSGSDLHTSEAAWVMKQAGASYGDAATNKEWVLEGNFRNLLGGVQ